MNPTDLRRGIETAVKSVVKDLESGAKPIKSKEEVAQVASISANGDTEVGSLIAEAMEKVGQEGVITIQDGKTMEDQLDVVEGGCRYSSDGRCLRLFTIVTVCRDEV